MIFEWSDLVPSGHRSLTSETSLLRTSIISLNLISPEGKFINLLAEDNEIKEIDRLVFASGSVGTFSGIRNKIHRGFVISSTGNSQEIYNEESKLIHERYFGYEIQIEFKDCTFRCDVQHLMDKIYLEAHISVVSMDNEPLEKVQSSEKLPMTIEEKLAFVKQYNKERLLTDEELAVKEKELLNSS